MKGEGLLRGMGVDGGGVGGVVMVLVGEIAADGEDEVVCVCVKEECRW